MTTRSSITRNICKDKTCDPKSQRRSFEKKTPQPSSLSHQTIKQIQVIQESEESDRESDGETLYSEDASHDSDFSEHSSDLDFIDDSEVVECKRDTTKTRIR
jgi:hypothetical protein